MLQREEEKWQSNFVGWRWATAYRSIRPRIASMSGGNSKGVRRGIFKQGVAIRLYNRQSYTRFKYLSAKILEMGGEASIVEMKFMDPRDEKDMMARFRAQALEELSQLKDDCAEVLRQLAAGGFTEDQSEQVKRMIRRYSKARSRNHFGLSAAQDVEKGLYSIISVARQASIELSSQLAKAMDKAVK